MARQKMPISSLTLLDTDHRCYELRKHGLTYQQIADALGISSARSYNGVKRSMERIGRQFAEDNRSVFNLELDRLDAMLVNLWPLTMPHDVVTTDRDGKTSTVRLPVSMEAVDRVLKIMDRRAKMLGFDNMQITVTAGRALPNAGGHQGGASGEITPKDEAMGFLRILAEAGVVDPSVLVNAGVLDAETAAQFRSQADIVEAEIVEDDDEDEFLALGQGNPDEEGFLGDVDEDGPSAA